MEENIATGGMFMPNETEHQKRLAVEMILNSEGLTDDLQDAAAKRLLNWGVVQAERLATGAGGDELDRVLSRLRRLVKRVNSLVADRSTLGDDEFAAMLNELVAAASELFGRRDPSQVAVEPLLAGRRRLDEAALVEQITALLAPIESKDVGNPVEGEVQSERRQRQGCGLSFWRRR